MSWDWLGENARRNIENARQQERFEAERRHRELLAAQNRANDIAERGSNGSGIIGLLLLGLFVAGIVWTVMWFVGVVRRVAGRNKTSPDTPNDPNELDLLNLMRRHNVDPGIISKAIRDTLRRRRG